MTPGQELCLNPEMLSAGNRVRLLKDGREAFPLMLHEISTATHSVLVEMYTFESDKTGMKFAQALTERAKAGVKVRVLYDSLGSRTTATGMFQDMRLAGVAVAPFRPLGWFTIRKRDHRKLIVIDGRVGFVGGLNLTDEYAPPEEGGQNWRDAMVRIEGPEVADLVAFFSEVWYEEKTEGLFPMGKPGRAAPFPDGVPVSVMGSGTRKNRLLIGNNSFHAVRSAQKRIWIANAYFIPVMKYTRMIRRAAQRGVDVRILAPSMTDVRPVYHAGRRLWGELLRRGVRIFEFQKRVLHSKTMVIDGVWSSVGSYNFDHLSIARNLEMTAIVLGPQFGTWMEAAFEEDCSESVEITREAWSKRGWDVRVKEWFWYQFRSLL